MKGLLISDSEKPPTNIETAAITSSTSHRPLITQISELSSDEELAHDSGNSNASTSETAENSTAFAIEIAANSTASAIETAAIMEKLGFTIHSSVSATSPAPQLQYTPKEVKVVTTQKRKTPAAAGSFEMKLKQAKLDYYVKQARLAADQSILVAHQEHYYVAKREECQARTRLLQLDFQKRMQEHYADESEVQCIDVVTTKENLPIQ